jgi:anti-sigma factor RsiW
MTIVMRCEEKARLVGYLYDECSAAERSAVEAHLSRCAVCAAELDGLKDVRTQLAEWNAPPADLGFRVTRDPVAPAASRRSRTLPAWAQAAAAVLVLAAGAGVANLQIEYGNGGVTVRTGWANARQDTGAAARPAPQVATVEQLRDLEQRVRALTASVQNAPPATSPAASPAPRATAATSPEVAQQVRAILVESEERQRKEFAFRLAQVVRDLENQRGADLVRIEQNLRQLEGVTGEQVQGQHEMMNYLRRVSSSPRP